jgi:hypothetical protein
VAAINAGGVTIHSFFQLPFHPHIPSQYIHAAEGINSGEPQHVAPHKMGREKIGIIKSIDLLVIDEISMVRADLLDAIDGILRRYQQRHLPFGGIQVLMIGDLQQLAPIVKDDDRELLDQYYDCYFFFGSFALRQTDYVTIELKHIYRQRDFEFINLLNNIRDNQVDSATLDRLNERYNPQFNADSEGGYITLTTHNSQAQSINQTRLGKLAGKSYVFKAEVKDDFSEYNYPTSFELILKSGAQVMFVKNDISKEKQFFNGKIGRIEGFEDDTIIVKCPGDQSVIMVEIAVWYNMKYTLDNDSGEIKETVIGTFMQYPLKLAWAITIHKSQGLTFDRAIIDAKAAFAYGQVYVALSRCRNLEGLVLSSKLEKRGIINDPLVTLFTRENEQNRPDINVLNASKRAYQQMLISELFDFDEVLHNVYYTVKLLKDNQDSLIGNLHEKLTGLTATIKTNLIDVSGKFGNQWKQLFIMNVDVENNAALKERLMKACGFFSEKLEVIGDEISGITIHTDNKTIRKAITGAIQRISESIAIKMACLNSCKEEFSVKKYLETKARASIEKPVTKSSAKLSIEDTSGIIRYPVLFDRLKVWRNQQAIASHLPHYMVLMQKTMVSLVNLLPQNTVSMISIKGMGQKKITAYGQAILEIISAYCHENDIHPPPVDIPSKSQKSKPKADTKTISFNLYKEGKKAHQIAEERFMAISTVEGHLAHFVATGDLSVHDFVAPAKIDMIAGYFEKYDDLSMGPAKAALGDNVSWSDLRFMVKHIEFLRTNQKNELK